jgi:hypothetical protein
MTINKYFDLLALDKAKELYQNKLCDTRIHTLRILHLDVQDQPLMMYSDYIWLEMKKF